MKRIALILLCLMPVLAMGARKVTWVIDPGHGGHDTGCEGRRSNEKTISLAVAKEVGRLVKKHIDGVRVVYTREKDTYPTLSERCHMANARGAELFISIHVNSAPNPYVRGTESFYAMNVPLSGAQAGKSELLALLLQRQYLSHGREISRGVKQRELYVCENTNMPSVLTEIGFITNETEEAYMTSKAGQQELADAIYKALAEYRELTKNGAVDKAKLRNLRYSHYAPLTVAAPKNKAAIEVIPTAAEQAKEAAEEAVEVAKDNKAKAEAAKIAKAEADARAKAEAEEKAREKALAEAKEREEAEARAKAEALAKAEDEAKAKANVAATATTEAKAKAETKTKADTEAKVKAEAEDKAKAGAETTKKAATEAANEKPYFAIQLMNTATKLKEGDYRLKGFKGVTYVPSGDRFKVIYSHATDYQVIKNELVGVRETFPEAFIVAFLGDRQITTAEAIELMKKNSQ